MKYISSDSIINDYIRRYGSDTEPIDDSFIKSIVDDTLSKIVPKALQKIDIVHINIKNFRGKLPKNYSSDLQALFRLKKDKRNETRIVGLSYEIEGINCKTEVTTKCSLCHQEQCWCPKHIMEIKPDIFWKMSNPEFFAATSKFFSDFYNQEKWYHGDNRDNKFYLMSRTTDNWFAIKYYTKDCDKVDGKAIEYKILEDNILTNFEEGEVLLCYFGEYLDENGYKKLPEDPRVIEALMTAILHAVISKKYYTQLTPDLRLALDRLDSKLEKDILRARVELDTPDYNELLAICQNVLRKMFDPFHWYSGGMRQPDVYNPSNNYNIISRY